MKNWSLGYEIIRTYVRFALWLTHKRITVTGQHLLPDGKPIIFAANHQNALMDPLAVACTNRFQTMWLARADIFKSKTASSFLKYLKLLPVYRIRDGKDNLSNNELIFAQVARLLEYKETVALFPEAAHSGRRQMLPHKKAIPRIALEAEAKNNFTLDLQIVPVGIYYDHYWAFNRSLIIEYGEPISIDKYRDEYLENPQKAMLSLRDEIYNRIVPLTLQINSDNYYQEYEDLRLMAGKTYSNTHFFSKNKHLQLLYAQKELVGKLEQLEIAQPEQFGELIKKSAKYFNPIREANLSDRQIEKSTNASWTILFGKFLTALISLPVFLAGFIFNVLPFAIPRTILRRRVKDITFLSTFNFAAGLVVFPIFYLIEATVVLALTDSWLIAIAAFLIMPFAGKLAFQLSVFYRDFLRSMVLVALHKTQLRKITKYRTDMIKLVLEMIA